MTPHFISTKGKTVIALSIAKSATELVVSMGVGTIIGNAVKATSPANMNLVNRVFVGAGSYALGSLAGSMASKHTVDQLEQTVTQIKELQTALPSKKK